MTTIWHTTNEPIWKGEPITDARAVATALRLSRTNWHTCVDGRVPPGHIYAGPLRFDFVTIGYPEAALHSERLVSGFDWAEPAPMLVVAPGSMGTLAQDIEFLRRDGQAHIANLVADLRKRLFGE